MAARNRDLQQAKMWALIAADNVQDAREALDDGKTEDEVLFLLDQIQSAVSKTRSFVQKHHEASEGDDG